MKKIIIISAFFTAITTVAVYGQVEKDTAKISVDVEADLVSSYVWRGIYQTGVSVQPALSLSAYGATLGAWGSTDFSTFAKELDFYISYEIGGFSVSVTDYWWSGEGESFFKERSGHYFEAGLSYTFPEKFPLSIGINTMFLGDGDKDEEGKQRYSTYISASYPFPIGDTECEVGIGVSPWEGLYSDKFNVATISAKAAKKLKLSSEYSLPVFVEAIFSPAQDNAYLVFGIKF